MEFTSKHLRQSSDQFRHALREADISIGWEASFNLWGRIVTGKDYSPAFSQAEHQGTIRAIPIDVERIVTLFAQRRKTVDPDTALKIFANAVQTCLPEVSPSMHTLWRYVNARPGSCLAYLSGNRVGVFERDKPGYLPVEAVLGEVKKPHELNWIGSSAALTVSVVNHLGGVSSLDSLDIRSSSIRESFKKNEQVFIYYFEPRIEEFSAKVAEGILKIWPDPKAWDRLDYDQVSDTVFDIIDAFCRHANSDFNGWLKPDCTIGEALLDHVTARARDALRVFADNPGEAQQSLASTIKFAAKKIIC